MRTHNANVITYELVTIFDKIAAFTEYRLDLRSIPEGTFCYDLRGSVDDSGIPIALEKYVENEYYCGTLLFKENIDLRESGCLDIYEKIEYKNKYLALSEFINMEEKTFRLPVEWVECGFVEMKGISIDEVIEKFNKNIDDTSLPKGEYVDGSFQLSTFNSREELIESIKCYSSVKNGYRD